MSSLVTEELYLNNHPSVNLKGLEFTEIIILYCDEEGVTLIKVLWQARKYLIQEQ